MPRRGAFVVVVGPDGVGKTTFASELMRQVAPDGRYFHFRPPLRGGLHTAIPSNQPQPKREGDVFGPLGWLRIARSVCLFWAGYALSVRPELRRGSLVIADRWAYGYLVQPRALGFDGPGWMASAAVALLPQPDVIFNLEAPPEVVTRRKAELSIEAIREELTNWKRLPGRLITLDALQTPEAMSAEARRHLEP